MSAVLSPTPTPTAVPPAAPPAAPVPRKSLADLLRELGDIPADRVRLYPYPGTATEADAEWGNGRGGLCELIRGTLVDKPMSVRAEYVGTVLLCLMMNFVGPRRLGMVIGPKAYFRTTAGNLRLPDVSFTRRDRLPNPLPNVGGWCPDLCVEVLSPGNTKSEMADKRAEYFAAGCRLMWLIDPRTRTAEVYTGPDALTRVDAAGALDGRDVIPGFSLPLPELFAQLDDLAALGNPPPA